MRGRPPSLHEAAAFERRLSRTLADFSAWMDRERGYAITTRMTRRQHVQQVERFVRGHFKRALVDATTEQLIAFLASFRNSKTRNSYLIDLRSFFEWARERGHRRTDPTAGIRRFREPRYLPRPLNAEEIRCLRVAARTMTLRHQVIIDLALFTGARRAEMAALSWSDVDFSSRRIRFFGKGAKDGIVPMHDELSSLLWRWRGVQPGRDEWVFPSERGGHLKPASIWREVREVGGVAGVELSTHRLRHSFATELLEAGSDIRAVQELLRHASLASTQIYTAVTMRRLEEDVARLQFAGVVGAAPLSPPARAHAGRPSRFEKAAQT